MNLYYFNFYVQKSFCQFNSFMSIFPKHLTSQRLQIEVKKKKKKGEYIDLSFVYKMVCAG